MTRNQQETEQPEIQEQENQQQETTQVELSDSVVTDNPKTKVKVSITTVKYFDELESEIKTVDVIGRLTIIESKKYVSNVGEKCIFISKENNSEEFTVDSVALYNLKGV